MSLRLHVYMYVKSKFFARCKRSIFFLILSEITAIVVMCWRNNKQVFFAYVSWKQRAKQRKNTGWCFYIQVKTTYKISGTFAKKEKHLRLSFSLVLHSPLQLWYLNLNEYFSQFSFFVSVGSGSGCHQAFGPRPVSYL